MNYLKPTLSIFIILITLSSCLKSTISPTITTYPIQGLWVGTYKDFNLDTSFFYSLSVHPGGNLSFEAKSINNVIYFGPGTWTLKADTFKFVVSSNYSGTPLVQTGVAVFDSTKGTLSKGLVSDPARGTTAIWSMKKIN